MSKLVHVYKDNDGQYYYKYLDTTKIDNAEVTDALELFSGEEYPYNIIQTGVIKPKPVSDDGNAPLSKPNAKGYYTKDQIDYEVIGAAELGWQFIKQRDKDFNNLKTGKKVKRIIPPPVEG